MRRIPLTLLLGIGTLSALWSLPLVAQNETAILAAQRSLETAQLRLRLYEREEHPRNLHRLEREIELAKAHVESYRRRVAEYEQFDKFDSSNALFLSLEEARLGLLQAELKLEELAEDRYLLLRHHSARLRLFQLEVDEAAQYLRELRK